jgi:metal-responsive CopG/Arc/MetJ family transcriptional regulator
VKDRGEQMKENFSISLNKELIDALDKKCEENGIYRSEHIAKLIIKDLGFENHPDISIEESFINIISKLFTKIKDSIEKKTLIENFNYKLSIEENEITIDLNNKKIEYKIVFLKRAVKIVFKVLSGSEKIIQKYKNTFKKLEIQFENNGFICRENQRTWVIEYELVIPNRAFENDDSLLRCSGIIEDKLSFINSNYIPLLLTGQNAVSTTDIRNRQINAPHLEVLVGKHPEKYYLINEQPVITIGRTSIEEDWHPSIDLTEQQFSEDENTVSRKHAQISKEGNNFFISDLGSKNGVFINSKELKKPKNNTLKKHRIKNGDTIILGYIILRFKEK